MTIEQANAYFASLPEGFAPARQLQEALSAKAGRVDYLGVAGTAGKLFGFEEGDVIGVRHDQLTVCLTGGHDELTDHSLGLLRRGDADAALAHDTGRQRGGALQ